MASSLIKLNEPDTVVHQVSQQIKEKGFYHLFSFGRCFLVLNIVDEFRLKAFLLKPFLHLDARLIALLLYQYIYIIIYLLLMMIQSCLLLIIKAHI